MIWITAAEIDNWTSREPRRAQELLPLLIGKLILASSKNIVDFHFPYGKSVQYAGYDGSLEVSDTSPFFPKGITAIEDGIGVFLNGGQGYFDKLCASVVHRLKERYPCIRSILVILYRDFKVYNDSLFDEIIYPFESHAYSYYTYKGNILKRSRQIVDWSCAAISYVYRSCGAEKTLAYAKRQGLKIYDLLE